MSLIESPHEGQDGQLGGNDELRYRLDQQSILAEFGAAALRSRNLDELLQRASEMSARGMRTQFAKVLTHRTGPERLCLTAGVGWRPGIVGLEVGADMSSPAGYAFLTGDSVISNHLGQDERFRTPHFMAEHGIKRAINVVIEVSDERFGVLEVDSRHDGAFEKADLAFMRGFANLLGVAIERQRAEDRLNQLVAHQELLTREASHRVKNSLSLVNAMLALQLRGETNDKIIGIIEDVQARIMTIARAHDLLWKGDGIGIIAIDELLRLLTLQLSELNKDHPITCNVARMDLEADAAIPIGLVLTELVTNSIKYAYGDRGGPIDVTFGPTDGNLVLSVTDKGKGLPADYSFDSSSSGLGTRMVASLARQLHASLEVDAAAIGTRITMTLPAPGGASMR